MINRSVSRLLLFLIVTSFLYDCKKMSEVQASSDSTQVDTIAGAQPINNSTYIPAPHKALRVAADLEDSTLRVLLKSIYFQDSLVQLGKNMKEIDVRISDWEYIQESAEMFASYGKCDPYKILQVTRDDASGSYLDWYTVMPDLTTSLIPLSANVTESQSQHTVKLSLDSELGETCMVVSVTESESGGDIDLRESSSISFYSVDKDGFNPIITINLTDKWVSDYYVDGGEPVTQNNTQQSYTVMSSVSNGLHDLMIDTSELTEQDDVANSDGEICKWNGSSYDCTPMMVD